MAIIMNTTRSGYSPEQCRSTITVGELIEFLSSFPADEPIYTGHDRHYTFGEIRESQFEILEREEDEWEDDDAE